MKLPIMRKSRLDDILRTSAVRSEFDVYRQRNRALHPSFHRNRSELELISDLWSSFFYKLILLERSNKFICERKQKIVVDLNFYFLISKQLSALAVTWQQILLRASMFALYKSQNARLVVDYFSYAYYLKLMGLIFFCLWLNVRCKWSC